jgi:hypothetical protein
MVKIIKRVDLTYVHLKGFAASSSPILEMAMGVPPYVTRAYIDIFTKIIKELSKLRHYH